MSTAAFLSAIREQPDDDGPRLVYADWLDDRGDPRGEFIRVQCDLAKFDPADERRPALASRADDLLADHEAEWLVCSPEPPNDWRFARGPLGHDSLSAAAFHSVAP